MRPNYLLTVKININFILDLLQKDPSKRMVIKEVLEHPWIQKYNKSTLNDRRRTSSESNGSMFKIYTTTDESEKINK